MSRISLNNRAAKIVEEIEIVYGICLVKSASKSVTENIYEKAVLKNATLRKSISELILMIPAMMKNSSDFSTC